MLLFLEVVTTKADYVIQKPAITEKTNHFQVLIWFTVCKNTMEFFHIFAQMQFNKKFSNVFMQIP